jgi:hypothetical protein
MDEVRLRVITDAAAFEHRGFAQVLSARPGFLMSMAWPTSEVISATPELWARRKALVSGER